MTDDAKCLCVISECYVDTNLAATLLDASAMNHQRGCNNVCTVMQKNFADEFAVGIIDGDKRQPTYATSFDGIASCPHLTLKKHKVRSHYIIVVSKAVEDFILSCANESNVSLEKYGLPNDMQGLKEVTKTAKSSKDSRFKRLFNDLAFSSKEMVVMKNVLAYLVSAKYHCDSAYLKRLFD